jgi:hypothetical protein
VVQFNDQSHLFLGAFGMNTRRHFRFVCLAPLAVLLCAGFARAQSGKGPGAAAANGGSEIVTKVYPVADLVFTAPNYPFQGFAVPGTSDRPSKFGSSEGAAAGGGAGGGGGFGGGGGGLGGGGFGGGGFNVPPESKQQAGPSRGGAFSVSDTDGMPMLMGSSSERLAQAIQVSIRPELWSAHGGPGTIVALGDRLIITQTKDIHSAIRDLLDALRANGGARNTVTIRAWWLRLDGNQYRELLADMPAASPPAVNRKQLERLAADSADYAEITCFDNQTVHVVSGRFRNAITGVIPVVGDNSAAYQPQMSTHLAGGMLEVTPTRLPDSKAVVLNLHSIVSRWDEKPAEPMEIHEIHDVVKLDRVNIVSQQLATTLKLPVRQPVLVGGLSQQPGAGADANGDKSQLYLVVEALDEAK